MQLGYQLDEYAHNLFFSLCIWQHCLHVPFADATENALRNQAVIAGSNATLRCRSDSNGSSQWKHRQRTEYVKTGANEEEGDDEKSLTFNQNTLSQDARITLNTTIDGQYDLHITNADRSDAGIYSCITEEKSASGNGTSITIRYEAQLVILAFDPNCSLSTNSSNNRLMENDYIQLHCYVRLIGHLVPVMIWRREGQLITGAETKTTKAPVGNQITVRSSLLLQVSLMDNEVTFSCDTLFTPNLHNISSDGFLIIAKNIPDYKYIWTSPPINVSYGPQNVTIQINNMSDNGAFVKLRDQFQCFANGNPTPRYEWMIFAELRNISVQSSHFVLNACMLYNYQLTAECKAMNEFSEVTARLARNATETGHICDTIPSEIHGSTTPSSMSMHSGTSIVFVVLVLVGILSALILIVIGRRNNIICRYNKGNGENRSEIENDCSLYSDVRDERNAWSFRIASNDYYQNGKREGQVETGNNNVSHDNLVAIYDEVKTYECDLTATGDSMHYASVELSTPQCDIRCTKGLNSNSIKQETLKPNQNVGADGTIYTEVKGTENLYSTVQKEPKSTSFKKSDYAAIDHTVKSLPPPPRLPQ